MAITEWLLELSVGHWVNLQPRSLAYSADLGGYITCYTHLSAQANRAPPHFSKWLNFILGQVDNSVAALNIVKERHYVFAHLTRKQGVIFKFWKVDRYLLTTLLWSCLQKYWLCVEFAVTITANLAQHGYAVLQLRSTMPLINSIHCAVTYFFT